jgi:hypothetical protein
MRPIDVAAMRSRLVRTMREGAEQVGRAFTRPDDDWMFVMLGVSEADEQPHIITADPMYFSTPERKQELTTEVLPRIIRERSIVVIGQVVSTWIAYTGEDFDPNTMRPSESPSRKEAVLVMAVDRFGDEFYSAEIVRRAHKPPILEPWQRIGGESDSVSGMFIDPLRAALRLQG